MDTSSLSKFRLLAADLQRRPHLYVQPLNYFTLAAFVDGYMLAIEDLAGVKVRDGFVGWLRQSKGALGGVGWPFALLQHVADDDDTKAMSLLMPLLLEYLEDVA